MAERISCPACGETIAEGVTERGVLPADGGPEIPFRRTTDYVMCPGCFLVYSVRDLQNLAAGSAADEDEDDVIEHLERMAERNQRPAS